MRVTEIIRDESNKVVWGGLNVNRALGFRWEMQRIAAGFAAGADYGDEFTSSLRDCLSQA